MKSFRVIYLLSLVSIALTMFSCSQTNRIVKQDTTQGIYPVFDISQKAEIATAIRQWENENRNTNPTFKPLYPIVVKTKDEAEQLRLEMRDDFGIYAFIEKIEDDEYYVVCFPDIGLLPTFELND